MNDKTNQLIFEKYQQIQEKSPVGLGQRFGNWAKTKVANVIPFTGDWKARLQGEKQAQTEINQLKTQFERFKGQFRLKKDSVQARHLYSFLRNYGIPDSSKTMKMLRKNPNFYLDDKSINENIKNAYQDQAETNLVKTSKPHKKNK
jgi:hypothetical protein